MSTNQPGWTGDKLTDPVQMQAFTMQLRRFLEHHADRLAVIRKDAQQMWADNPPEGYGKFEDWWQERQVNAPFDAIEEHIREAARLTHRLEARFRKGRFDLPAKRREAKARKEGLPALNSGTGAAMPKSVPRPVDPAVPATGQDFMDLIIRKESA